MADEESRCAVAGSLPVDEYGMAVPAVADNIIRNVVFAIDDADAPANGPHRIEQHAVLGQAVGMMPDAFMNAQRVEIVSLAARYRLPAIYPFLIGIGIVLLADKAESERAAASIRFAKSQLP